MGAIGAIGSGLRVFHDARALAHVTLFRTCEPDAAAAAAKAVWYVPATCASCGAYVT